jgi:hydroxyethylthiazole kinase-like uncharacterized protein yjeF
MTLQRFDAFASHTLHDAVSTRLAEHTLAQHLPPHALMRRAGEAIGRLAMALAPHARKVWIACGPGNNGGDGLEAALFLKSAGMQVVVTCIDSENTAPQDAQAAMERACAAGIEFIASPPPLDAHDLCIDCLLGIGMARAVTGQMAEWIAAMNGSHATVLSADIPTGLHSDTGVIARLANGHAGATVRADHTLMLLTVKPGFMMGEGRDAAGQLWLDDLTTNAQERALLNALPGCSQLNPAPPTAGNRAHNSHKGSYGDVAIVGGESLDERGMGMTGAALLAASAALHGGAGRILISLLQSEKSSTATEIFASQPEWMMRTFKALALNELTVVCGCGGGLAITKVMAEVLEHSQRLVLDADALNAIARDNQLAQRLKNRQTRSMSTVLTPHPLEAARLLGCTTADIQAQRLRNAEKLAQQFNCTVVLKGSGSVIASPGEISRINPTGNGRLATAGTGDVLAGLIGAKMAQGENTREQAFEAACHAVYEHGLLANTWQNN